MVKTDSFMICDNLSRDNEGRLCLASRSVSSLAKKYGTPLYLYDEAKIREKCRTYLSAAKDFFPFGSKVMYASKAASFKRLYEIMAEEGMGIDVVSVGEIYTAKLASFPLERAYFHSNNKTDFDIEYAIKEGVGYFVVDNAEELYAINEIASSFGKNQKVLLRITPGIDPHTYAAVATGKVDSKFGSAIVTGQAEQMCALALSLPSLELYGFHCHIGSQIFDSEVYIATAQVMLDFLKDMEVKLGYFAKELDIGGGLGVRYIADQPETDIRGVLKQVGEYMSEYSGKIGISLPTICFEPGRSIVADAGLTVYTVGTVKNIPGYKTYVSVDGGMTDNPRYALYGSPYTILPADREIGEDAMTCSVVGRCCESGDILQENVQMPSDICRGEYIACLTTGAYHYSMASNYNRIPRAAVVMLRGDEDYVAVKRENFEDLTRLDV